jgi:hypothetical protein
MDVVFVLTTRLPFSPDVARVSLHYVILCMAAVMRVPSLRLGARAAGHTRYFTGVPCRHGHLSTRWTCDGKCTACKSASSARRLLRERLGAQATGFCTRCGGPLTGMCINICYKCRFNGSHRKFALGDAACAACGADLAGRDLRALYCSKRCKKKVNKRRALPRLKLDPTWVERRRETRRKGRRNDRILLAAAKRLLKGAQL